MRPAQCGAGAIVHPHSVLQRVNRRVQQLLEEMVAVSLHRLDQRDATSEVSLEVLLLGDRGTLPGPRVLGRLPSDLFDGSLRDTERESIAGCGEEGNGRTRQPAAASQRRTLEAGEAHLVGNENALVSVVRRTGPAHAQCVPGVLDHDFCFRRSCTEQWRRLARFRFLTGDPRHREDEVRMMNP